MREAKGGITDGARGGRSGTRREAAGVESDLGSRLRVTRHRAQEGGLEVGGI